MWQIGLDEGLIPNNFLMNAVKLTTQETMLEIYI